MTGSTLRVACITLRGVSDPLVLNVIKCLCCCRRYLQGRTLSEIAYSITPRMYTFRSKRNASLYVIQKKAHYKI